MLKRTMKGYAFMPLSHDQNGFSLVSTLISVFATLLIFFIAGQVFTIISQHKNDKDLEVFQFFHFLEDEWKLADQVKIDHNQLIFEHTNGDKINYSLYQKTIRRQVNGLGHEIMLREVESWNLSRAAMVHLSLVMKGGKQYEKKLIPFP
ncbi:ComGF family competence protein [Gracilibacillus dipsosauri]|uniref:Competence protein ComGF n=1 Tax=Gracilibacillus dipsosauri TaxID=178340 RepID=A0A317KYF9_9BACI|nr:ComGF family competence protein [Gracilibacillus dipsosauri]PWU68527.1 hypothetical protein DLJ74_08805 [Gracilibacillus dipsosauri]